MAQTIDGQSGRSGAFRRGLMLYGSTAAIAASLMVADGGIGPAMAQDIGPRISPTVAAQGDFTAPGGTPAPYYEYRSGTLDIIKMPRDAVLNWTTYDTAPKGGANGSSYVNFLPKDAELRFTGNGESFTAVNRIFTTPDNAGAYRGIAFQGKVTSYLYDDGPSFVGPVGGNIWFYSPGGILATGSASFNVGSLLLSASDLTNYNEFGRGRSVDFSGVADPFASVVLHAGARVTLTENNSSFAIVAPTIEQGGDVFVNGSVLYLSGEQGTLAFNADGTMFSATSVEAQGGNEIRHLGITSGPTSIGARDFSVYDPQTIEFRTGRDVGVLLSGTIGYAPATDATLMPNGSILLTAGSVTSGGDLTFASDVAIAADTVALRAGAEETISAGGDINGGYSLYAEALVNGSLGAEAGGRVDVAGNVTFASPDQLSNLAAYAAGASGNMPGGTIAIGGDLTIDASVGYNFVGGQQGGDAQVDIGDGGSVDVAGDMDVRGDSFATEDANSLTSARAGEAIVSLSGAGSRLIVGGALSISADALPASGQCECSASSGSATGGYAALTATAGTITANNVTVSASAEANFDYYDYNRGPSPDAGGGTALVQLHDSIVSAGGFAVSASAIGADGGTAQGGGSATGGTAQFSKGPGGSLTTGRLDVNAEAIAGAGGGGNGDGSYAAAGGDAQGGNASVVLLQQAQTLGLFGLNAGAQGGGGGSEDNSSGASGADGGRAIGGTAMLYLSGGGNAFSGIAGEGISVGAYGGDGGFGAPDYYHEIRGGSGGEGGAATGGTLTITAANGAEYVSSVHNIASYAGAGGAGGDGFFGETGAVAPGEGGIGGDAIGANAMLVADGGLISGELQLLAGGEPGAGGRNGFNAGGSPNGSAAYGLSTGGSISLRALDNGPSRFELTNALLYTSGDTAGAIDILDRSTAAGASLHFGQLSAASDSYSRDNSGSVHLVAGNNAIAIDGFAGIDADSIALDFSGSGRLEVGGYTQLTSQVGAIAITHTNGSVGVSVDSLGPIQVYANGDYSAGAGSIVRSANEVDIRALGAIDAADTRGGSTVTLFSANDLTVGNITSMPGSGGAGEVQLFAGREEFDGSNAFKSESRATITGAIVANGSVLVESGGFAEFASGSQLRADRTITVRTGDDILIRTGASLVSDIAPSLSATMYLLAGDINAGPGSGDLIGPITTPIASLVVAGSIDTNGHALYLSGDAIDGKGSSIVTGGLFADVTDAPFIPPFSNDAGLLTSGCFQGSVCLGGITATGNVAIGLASNNGLVSLRAGAVDFTGANFDVATFDRIDLGNTSLPGVLTASGRISLTSESNSIGLTNLTLQAPDLRISAGGSLEGETSSLISPNSILLHAGSSVSSNTISTGGILDDGSGSGLFHVPGAFAVAALIYGGTSPIAVIAGGDISIGHADANGSDIALEAGQALLLGSTAPNARTITLGGASIGFDNLSSTGLVRLTARNGGIAGASGISPVIETNGNIVLDAAGDIVVDDLVADGGIALSGNAVTAAGLFAGAGVDFAALNAGHVGSFSSGGDATFAGASLDLGTGSAGGGLHATARSGAIAFSNLSASGDGDFDAAGALTGGDIGTGGALTLTGVSMAIGTASGDSGVAIEIAGNASFAALVSSEAGVRLDAGRKVTGGKVDASRSADLHGRAMTLGTVTAGADITIRATSLAAIGLVSGAATVATVDGLANIAAADAGGSLHVDAGTIDGGNFASGTSLQLNAGSLVQVASATAGTRLQISSGDAIDAGTLTAADAISANGHGAVAVGEFASGGESQFYGATLVLGMGRSGGDLIARTLAGDLAFSYLSATGAASLSAEGALDGGDIVADGMLDLSGASLAVENAAGGKGVSASIAGNASFASLTSTGGSVLLNADGDVNGGDILAATTASLTGSDVVLGAMAAGTDLDLAAESLLATSLAAGDELAIGVVKTASIHEAVAGAKLSLSAESLAADRIEAGTMLDIALGGVGAIGQFASGSDANVTGSALTLGTAAVGGALSAQASAGDLAFTDISAASDIQLDASGLLSGGDVEAGETLTLTGARLVLGAAAGAAGVAASTPGAASFTALNSANGGVALDAGGAVAGGSVGSGGVVAITGASVALDAASFGNGLAITARGGGIGGAGLYKGKGAVALRAARGIGIGSVDTLGGITLEAGAEARFVELRSRDGSVRVTATGAIDGSSVAATGSNPAGDDSVSLTAGGAITLDGATTVLNAVSSAQDDFIASAGGALAIVRAEAGRDLTLSAGGGSLSADTVASGRDLSLSGPTVQLTAGDVARNLFVRANAGDITGAGTTTAGGTIDLGARDNITVGSLAANGGSLTADAGGGITFANLAAAGDLTLHAGAGIAGSGDIMSTGAVVLSTTSGATALRDIQADGAIALAGAGALAMRDILQNASGSLTVAYEGAIALRDVVSTGTVDISGGADVAFRKIRSPDSIALEAAGAAAGAALDASNAIVVRAASMALGSVAVGKGDATLEATGNALSAESVSAYNIAASAAGNLAIAKAAASQSAALSGANLKLGTVTAGRNLALTTFRDGDIAFDAASAGGQALVQAGGSVMGGMVSAGELATVDAGEAITLTGLEAADARLRSSGGAVSASGIAVGGVLNASGASLALAGPGALTVTANASAGGIAITTGGDLHVDAAAPGAISLTSTGGSVAVGSVGNLDSALGGIGTQGVSGGSAVSVAATNAISVADSLTAGGALTMTAGGLISLDGSATGQIIALQAADLAIGSTGSLGSATTQRISLASTAAVTLGTGASGGFAVDQAEFGRIRSGGDLMVSALGAQGAGLLTVSNLTIDAGEGGQIGASGIFGLASSGRLAIGGTLAIAGAGTGNTLSLTGDAIDLDYAHAALAVLDDARAATGRIVADGRLITSLSSSAAADIAGKTPDEITLRLGRADMVRTVGLLQTGALTLQGRGRILIQNSGSGTGIDDRRGLTVGALTINGATDGKTLVVINGVIGTQTGADAARRVVVATSLFGGSSVNGCVLANIAGCLAVVPPPPPPPPEPAPLIFAPASILFGVSDLIKDQDDDEVEDGVADGKPEAPPIDTHNIDDPAGRPMIDDPVTGAGNEDLWQPPE